MSWVLPAALTTAFDCTTLRSAPTRTKSISFLQPGVATKNWVGDSFSGAVVVVVTGLALVVVVTAAGGAVVDGAAVVVGGEVVVAD